MDKHKAPREATSAKLGEDEREKMSYSTRFYNESKQYGHGSIREYAQDLNSWLYQYRMWNAVQSFSVMLPYYFPPTACTQTFPFTNATRSSVNSHTGGNGVSPPNISRQQFTRADHEISPQQGPVPLAVGAEYTLPPLWKRVLAEAIDFLVLFYLKVMMTLVVLRHMGYLRNDNPLELQLDFGPVFDITELDIEKAFNMTSEIIALEVINRIMITIFETLCLRKGFGVTYGGSTPGKRMLGMKVVSCDQIVDIRDGKVLVIPARDIGFFSALVRSVIKNFTLAFFFPACLTVFFFDHNRAAYDVLAKTIVVNSEERRQR